jgi:hydrogenase expression/formation protein HypD
MAIARFGLRSLMPEGLRLISGPGCPVCVTPTSIINASLKLAENPGNVIATFGDMMRVPGTDKTLEILKAEGADVRILYSSLDMLEMARLEREKKFIFISVGFETTTPGIALSILEAEKMGLKNVFFLVANRLVIPAMHALCTSEDIEIDGFICPGHVSVIIGSGAYNEIADQYSIPCVVAGFEPVDILMAISDLIERIVNKTAGVGNAYGRVVSEKGNVMAMDVMEEVFKPVEAEWRGIGFIPQSGLALQDNFLHFDALRNFDVPLVSTPDPKGCRCGDVLKGIIIPPECGLFGKVCVPEKPIGPCMVSSEGSCAAYYKYEGVENGRK